MMHPVAQRFPAPSETNGTTQPTVASVEAYLKEHVHTLDLTVRHEHLFEDATIVVLKVFPQWSAKELTLTQCRDGITNKLVRCKHEPTGMNVLIRAYGRKSETIIDREREITVSIHYFSKEYVIHT
jgi:ethanolamine kinase